MEVLIYIAIALAIAYWLHKEGITVLKSLAYGFATPLIIAVSFMVAQVALGLIIIGVIIAIIWMKQQTI